MIGGETFENVSTESKLGNLCNANLNLALRLVKTVNAISSVNVNAITWGMGQPLPTG